MSTLEQKHIELMKSLNINPRYARYGTKLGNIIVIYSIEYPGLKGRPLLNKIREEGRLEHLGLVNDNFYRLVRD